MFSNLIGSFVNFGLNKLFGDDSAEDAEAAAQGRFNQQMDWSREQFERNLAAQREFAQSGIRWRVDDAKAAGIHPLFAIGGGGAQYSPVVTAGGDNFSSSRTSPQYDFSGVGQDISRAISAGSTKDERFQAEFNKQALAKGDLEIQLLQADLAKKVGQLGPAIPSVGDTSAFVKSSNAMGPGSYGSWEVTPNEVIAPNPTRPDVAAGFASPTVQWGRTKTGVQAFPPKLGGLDDIDLTNPIGMDWTVRHRLNPYLGSKQNKPPLNLLDAFPGAVDWSFDRLAGEWRPVYRKEHARPREADATNPYSSWYDTARGYWDKFKRNAPKHFFFSLRKD